MKHGVIAEDWRESNRRGGFYWIGEPAKPYVSVTTVLQVVSKPAIQYWFGREVYRAMVIDPTLSEKEALAAPYAASKVAMSRGTTVHSIVEAYKHTGKYIETIPEKYRPYAQAFYNWVEEMGVTIDVHEKTLISEKYGYAGTMDILGHVKGREFPVVLDVKTGKDIYDDYFLQLSAYEQAVNESGIKTSGTGIILLKENGRYKFEYGEPSFSGFEAALNLYKWKNREELKKYGYGEGGKNASKS